MIFLTLESLSLFSQGTLEAHIVLSILELWLRPRRPPDYPVRILT